MSDIELKQIKVFIAVVQSNGLTAAQARLGMSCSAISKHLSDLETRTRLTLCYRGRNGFKLTDEGHRFYQASLKLHTLWQTFKQDVAALSQAAVPKLTIGTVDATLSDARNPLPAALHCLAEEFAQAQISVQLMTADEVAEGVLNQQLDFGVSYRPENKSPLHSSLYYQEQLSFIANADLFPSVADRGNMALWLDIAVAHGLVSFKSSQNMNGQATFGKQLQTIKEQICCNNIEEIVWQTLINKGVGLLPTHVLAQYNLATLGLVALDLSEIHSDIYLVYRKDKVQTSIVSRIMTLLLPHSDHRDS